ncbi:uncharacterized protein MELLADRAFT_110513 [Melampsora larici-populina 98AG31]|uniref:Secreted protein n=1 Tax=Melampsora larici-populina (strain 98AG31 / pathotype 3-4-7) TaxID=747676 RepID=F4S028_MELLP|nr:uncharacterized protein MELLADRAFT_110513 [Melampsora larici-populina 98AG31]EGG01892.1 hypothetical protein MELLADRAFT_110513 [Melampsora larici-populina 98AG31]
MLLQFHHILILAITAEGMFLPHHGGDDPRTAISFTALLNGEEAGEALDLYLAEFILEIAYSMDSNIDGTDHATWKPEESFIAQTDQGSKKPSPTGEVLIGGDIVRPKGLQEPDPKSLLFAETPHTAGDNTPETSATRTTVSTNHESSQSEENRDSSGAEASSLHGTSIDDYAALSEDGNGENHGKSQKDTNLEYLQEPWSYEHELMRDGVTRAGSTLLDIDSLKDSDTNSLLASWSGWDRSPTHDQGNARESAGQENVYHRPSASPSQSHEDPKGMHVHISPIQTSSPQQQTPEISILGHKRPLMNGVSREDIREAKQMKNFDLGSFPFDLTVRVP